MTKPFSRPSATSQFKVTFSIKEGGHWDDPLLGLGRPLVTNLLMDPFERQVGER